jgi:FdhD protein
MADSVAAEEPLEIRVVRQDGDEAVTTSISITMRTPGEDFELAAGFLFTEGLVDGAEAVERISYCVDEFVDQQYNVVSVYLRPGVSLDPTRFARNFYTTSSCGVCGKASLEALRTQGCRPVGSTDMVVAAGTLCGLPAALRGSQAVFQQTGGLHAAGLFDDRGRFMLLREDVGRHNAVDKVVGERLLAGAMPLGDSILLVSGRASFEIMQKAAMAGIPVVAAVGAPSSLAVETAQEFGMTLVGFLRPDGFNVYTGAERIAGDR